MSKKHPRAKAKAAARTRIKRLIEERKITPSQAQQFAAPMKGPVEIVDIWGDLKRYADHVDHVENNPVTNANLHALALKVFGKSGAASWLAEPNAFLNGATPKQTARTAAGRRAVALLMKRVDKGLS